MCATIGAADGSGGLSDAAVARYVAKYATKSTESAGLELPPLYCRSCGLVSGRARGPLVPGVPWSREARGRRLAARSGPLRRTRGGSSRPAGSSAALPGLEELKLRRWAHMLGFRGHFATKSRSFSTTFGALRAERAAFTELVERGRRPVSGG